MLAVVRQTYRGQSFYDVDPKLVGAASRFFGGLTNAIEAAGLDLPSGRWSKRRIIELIQEYYVQGLPIAVYGFGNKKLKKAVERHFGKWREAVTAAGLESRMPTISLSGTSVKRVLEEIRANADSETKICKCRRRDSELYRAVKKYFGAWREGVLAAGCIPWQRRWSKEIVIHEIQERHLRDLPLTRVVVKQDAALASAATRYFGNWGAAVVAAGITQKKASRIKSSTRRRRMSQG